MKKILRNLILLTGFALGVYSCSNADDPISNVSGVPSKGLLSSPLNITESYSNIGQSKYVSGYIVGYASLKDAIKAKFDYTFSTDTCSQKVNVLIADSKSETNPSKCLTVELPLGKVRDSLNLAENKFRMGRKVTLFGSIEFYYGQTGIRGTSYFIDGKDTVGVKPASTIYTEKFLTSLGAFTSVSVSGTEKWYWTTYKYAMVSGYVGGVNKADTAWLISPKIDLDGVLSPKMSFDHVTRYFNTPAKDAMVLVSLNYEGGLPATAKWDTIPTSFTNASSWTFASSGELSLQKYAGKKVSVGLRYISTTTKAGTWELKNFLIYER